MAVNEIQVGRYNARLHKLMDMKEGAPAPVLAPEVFATIQLEGDNPEHAYLGGEHLCQYAAIVGASVGDYSMSGIFVPAGSNVIAIVDQITVFRDIGYILTRMCTTAQIATATGQDGVMRDSRLYGQGAAVQGFFDALAAVPGPLLDIFTQGGVVSETRQVSYVLHPGHALYCHPDVVNKSIRCVTRWRERYLEPSESR